ncbi:hypothetical protein AAHC03_020735 [Spirometra sp. Aus1]
MVNTRTEKLLSSCRKLLRRIRHLPRSLREGCVQSGTWWGRSGKRNYEAEGACCRLVKVTKIEEMEPWETFTPRFQSTPRRGSLVPIRCTVSDIELSQRSSQMNFSNAEESVEGNALTAFGEAPVDLFRSTAGYETDEQEVHANICDEVAESEEAIPIYAPPLGAVFGAPIQTQEESLQLPGVPHVLAVLIQKLEEHGMDWPALYTDMVTSSNLRIKMNLINSYPVDDLVRMRPKLFADPYHLATMITLYVECLPSRLVEGMEVWRSALATLPRNGEADLCMPETSVDLVLQSSEEVTCLRFTSFQLTGGVLSVHGEVGAYLATLDHLFTHWHKVWQLVRQRSQEEVVRLFILICRAVSGQTDDESVQVVYDLVSKWPEIRRDIIAEIGDVQPETSGFTKYA